ncbi:cytochrome P450 [Streptomyces sp. NPDC002643]
MTIDNNSLKEIDLLDPDAFVQQKHHDWFRRLRAEQPVFWHEDGQGGGFWNVVKHEDVVLVSRDSQLFSSELGGTQIYSTLQTLEEGYATSGEYEAARGRPLLDLDPPRHTRYRQLVSKGFTARMIGLLEQALRHRATHIIDQVIERGEADFVVDIASELPLQALAEIMGVPQEDRQRLFDWSNRILGDPEFADEGGVGSVMAELIAYSRELATQRRNDPRDDIVTKLLNAEIDGEKLSDLEFDMFMLLLSIAGHETTRNATTHGMYALLTHPEQFELLKSDPQGRMNVAVEEIIRWASPVLHFRRTATADTEIRGTAIKEGDPVVVWYVSANRDEDVFTDPFAFDVTRDPNPQISFGSGTHFCLGANLARMELRLIFEQLVTRMPDMRLAGEPVRLRSNFVGGIKHMPVTWTPGKRVLPVDADV